MIAAWLATWAPVAFGVTRTVNSTADTNTGSEGDYTGTLRYHLNHANPGDRIVFAANFSTPPTPITVATALPNLVDAGVILDGDGRVAIACAAAMTSGNGLTIVADDVQVFGVEVRDCPGDGVRVTGHDVALEAVVVHHNDQSGININGLSTNTSGVSVVGASAHHNCGAPAGLSCAGVIVKKGTGTGSGPEHVTLQQNLAYSQLSAGHGIAIQAGTDSYVLSNTTDDNAGSGISIAATTAGVAVDHVTVALNAVGGNLGAGILLGTRSSFVVATLNDVDGNGLGGVLAPGIHVYGSDDHTIEANTITSNGAEGILVSGLVGSPSSPAERLTIRGNLVGVDANGHSNLGNGGAGISISGSGTNAVHHTVESNTVANNASHGVYVNAGAVTLTENTVGLGPSRGAARPNGSHGILVSANGTGVRIDGKVNGVYRPNYVASNAGSGIVTHGANVLVADNVVGWSLTNDARGNGGDGVWVQAGTNVVVRHNRVGNSGGHGVRVEHGTVQLVVTTPTLNGNDAVGNGGAGIRVDAVSGAAKWIENTASGNGTCALSVGTAVNGTARDAVPVLVRRTGAYLEGTYNVPGGLVLDHIEVFADEGSEARRYLGHATTPTGTTWKFTMPDDAAPLQAGHRVSAVAVFTSGASSRMQEWCGDGCPEPGAASCTDGDDCTTDTCGGSTCSHSASSNNVCALAAGGCITGASGTCQAGACAGIATFASVGTACVDTDACTTNTTCDTNHACGSGKATYCEDGDPCTEEGTCDPLLGCPAPTLRPVGYLCDDGDLCNTGMGTCDGWGNCDVSDTPPPCPQQTLCNTCTCTDPGVGCICQGITGDGHCGPDDFWDEYGEPGADCIEPNSPYDTDFDGFPDKWEKHPDEIDVDCDGNPDQVIPGLANSAVFDAEVPTILWELDWMAGNANHEHTPGDFSPVIDMFDRETMDLFVDVDDEIPHVDQLAFGLGVFPNGDADTWVPFRQVKTDHFDVAHRRGVYHYGVVAHDLADPGAKGTSENFGDDVCGSDKWVYNNPQSDPDTVGVGMVAHEGGHNLGLNHNGSVPTGVLDIAHDGQDDVTLGWLLLNDPGQKGEMNHLSVMNGWYGGEHGGIIRWDGLRVYDYSRAYPTEVGQRLLLTLDQAAGYDEDDTLWEWTTPIRDDLLYEVEWLCPRDTPQQADEDREHRSAPVHRPGLTSLGVGDRDLDLNCDGHLGNAVVSDTLTTHGNTIHTSFDEWKAIQPDFQRDTLSLSTFGGVADDVEADEDQRALGPPPLWPRAELLGGCASPKIPRGTGPTWRTPLVLFGADDYPVEALAVARLNGADPVRTVVQDLDADGHPDLWMEFRPADMTRLHTDATQTDFYGKASTGRKIFAHFAATRVTNPTDSDGDGIQNACDVCPTQGHPPGGYRLPNGCPP